MVKRRVDHLKDHDSLSPSVVAEWRRARLDRLLVEYLLRAGCYSTATKVGDKSLMQYENYSHMFHKNYFDLIQGSVDELDKLGKA